MRCRNKFGLTQLRMINLCNKVIEYSFYALFFLVPLVFAGNTSELFELNKMWLTWGIAIIIGTFWITKMILQRRILLCRTPLDIPIVIFLVSQFISTIFSWDRYISFWGYYSRFNGGFLSTITYIFLYYAIVTNFANNIKVVLRILFVSLASGLIVVLWGIPSHFGHDPTCLIFRGNFDVSCWTADFQPKVRIFSTLGQPAWLAAYLAILIPIVVVFITNSKKNFILHTSYFILLSLFYIALIYANTRAGFLGLAISLIFLFLGYIFIAIKKFEFSIFPALLINRNLQFLILIAVFLIITFIFGTPINQLDRFTLRGIKESLQKPLTKIQPTRTPSSQNKNIVTHGGGTESGSIRLTVWRGALDIWKNHPLFGTGVETFAYAYYKYKPIEQNRVSEWNFLYNKAHNEYLNYLATTGAIGLGSYLLMIVAFIFLTLRKLNSNIEYRNSKQYQNSNDKNSKRFEHLDLENSNLFRASHFGIRILVLALLASYVSILITNFFGFSVVITNIYLFIIPAFVFILGRMIKINENSNSKVPSIDASVWQWMPIFLISTVAIFMLFTLLNFWRADIYYARGYNLNRVGEYQLARPDLLSAIQIRQEPVFRDELAVNSSNLATVMLSDKTNFEDPKILSDASLFAKNAIEINDKLITDYPKNVVFWKSRTSIFFTLSQVDALYLTQALEAIEHSATLAPNDANIFYNLGVLYGRNNNITKGIEALEKAIFLKPDYTDAHYALGIFYRTAATNENGTVVINQELNQKAISEMQYILNYIDPNNKGALDSIKNWQN